MFRGSILSGGLILTILLLNTHAPAQTALANPTPAPTKVVGSNNLLFANDATDFTLELPALGWRVATQPDDLKTNNVELVYGDRLSGFLQIRKIDAGTNFVLGEVIDREQTQKLQFLPNYVARKQEDFKGNLNGRAANYEYTLTERGKAMAGRAYFLNAGNGTIYVLRFTGLKEKLPLLRNQTDAIARTFKLKGEKGK